MNTSTDQQPEGMAPAEHVTEWTLHVVTGDREHELTFETLDNALAAMNALPDGAPAMLAKVVTTYYLRNDHLNEYRAFVQKEDEAK